MGTESESVVCRRCNEVYSVETENCPHCGRSQAGRGYWIAVGLGIVIAVTSAIGGLWFFSAVGLLLVVAAGYVIYDKRQRKQEAAQRAIEESTEL